MDPRVPVARMFVAAFLFFLLFLFPSFLGMALAFASFFLVPLSLAVPFHSSPPLSRVVRFFSVPRGADMGGDGGLRALITSSVICLIIVGSRSKVIGFRLSLSSGHSSRVGEDGIGGCALLDPSSSRSSLLVRPFSFDLVTLG